MTDDLRYDVRILAYRKRRGELSHDDIEKHLATLPDDAEEDVSDDATMVWSSAIGFEIAGRHGKPATIMAGYRASRYYCGAALLPGIVQVHSYIGGSPQGEALECQR